MNLSPYMPLCDAITSLMSPLVEVVIHDLERALIIYKSGNLSRRSVGDPSLIDVGAADFNDSLGEIFYEKINFDGRLIKSVSVPLKEDGAIKAILCINCDLSVFDQMQTLAGHFLRVKPNRQPECLFKNDWQERVNLVLSQELNKNNWTLESLQHKQKKILVSHLFKNGAFAQKNAADYIAKVLGLSRATIFNYLKEWRTHEK